MQRRVAAVQAVPLAQGIACYDCLTLPVSGGCGPAEGEALTPERLERRIRQSSLAHARYAQ